MTKHHFEGVNTEQEGLLLVDLQGYTSQDLSEGHPFRWLA